MTLFCNFRDNRGPCRTPVAVSNKQCKRTTFGSYFTVSSSQIWLINKIRHSFSWYTWNQILFWKDFFFIIIRIWFSLRKLQYWVCLALIGWDFLGKLQWARSPVFSAQSPALQCKNQVSFRKYKGHCFKWLILLTKNYYHTPTYFFTLYTSATRSMYQCMYLKPISSAMDGYFFVSSVLVSKKKLGFKKIAHFFAVDLK